MSSGIALVTNKIVSRYVEINHMIMTRKRKGEKKPAHRIALVLAFYFLFYGIDLAFLLEITPIDIGGLQKAIELIGQMDEILPSEDNVEKKKELPDSYEGYPRNVFPGKATGLDKTALMLWSLNHRFTVKEYVSEIISPPPEVRHAHFIL